MGWLSDAANAVADAVSAGSNAVGEIVSDVVESVGNAIDDGLDWAGADVPWRIRFTRSRSVPKDNCSSNALRSRELITL